MKAPNGPFVYNIDSSRLINPIPRKTTILYILHMLVIEFFQTNKPIIIVSTFKSYQPACIWIGKAGVQG